MRIHALAVDYDGTIAHHGTLSADTAAALREARGSGRRLILVTGRILEELETVCPELNLFDLVVAENGAVLYDPATRELEALGEPPATGFVESLRRRDVPCQTGHVIVATVEPHDTTVLEVIRDRGEERSVIFNKGAVMVLPAGVTKATGLRAALDRLKLSEHNAVGVGDAENDHNFLHICEVSVAVSNALPAIKERADIVLRRKNGRGVAQFIRDHLLGDLERDQHVFERYQVPLAAGRRTIQAPIHGANMLVLGSSGSGKSTLTGVFVEGLIQQGYQVCIIDPEGDHTGIEPLVLVGSAEARPTLEGIELALERVPAGVIVNLVALTLADKARFSSDLLSTIFADRAARGRPHWVIVDEAHHLLPGEGSPGTFVLPAGAEGMCFITMEARLLAGSVLDRITHLYVVGQDAGTQVERFAEAVGLKPPVGAGSLTLMEGEALVATVEGGVFSRPQRFRVLPRRTEHRRHLRKYAAGDLREQSFYFRGPERKLNLRAYNVSVFLEMGRGVDIDTWRFHLENGDIVTWVRDSLKDPDLAALIAEIAAAAPGPEAAREAVLAQMEARFTAGD